MIGCAILGLGIWLKVEKGDYVDISQYDYLSAANVAIAIGSVILVVSFLGCCGSIKEIAPMLIAVGSNSHLVIFCCFFYFTLTMMKYFSVIYFSAFYCPIVHQILHTSIFLTIYSLLRLEILMLLNSITWKSLFSLLTIAGI